MENSREYYTIHRYMLTTYYPLIKKVQAILKLTVLI